MGLDMEWMGEGGNGMRMRLWKDDEMMGEELSDGMQLDQVFYTAICILLGNFAVFLGNFKFQTII